MVIEIHDAALHGLNLTPEEALLDLAIGLYTERRVTLGRAAEIARLPQLRFQQELGRRGINLHYSTEDLAADVATLAALGGK
jgi:predicted HTH domain antitoxin